MSSGNLENLYNNHHGWLFGWLRARLGCGDSAADLAHDTYLRVLVTGNVPPVKESRRYLTRIAQGLLIDFYRRRQIEAAYLESLKGLPEPLTPSVEFRETIIETLLEIDRMLMSLPENVRRALLMRQLDGLSYREIAEQMAVSVSSVEKYVARGLAACYFAIRGSES